MGQLNLQRLSINLSQEVFRFMTQVYVYQNNFLMDGQIFYLILNL